MTELDFDELDKAVSSLMAESKAERSPEKKDAQTVVTITNHTSERGDPQPDKRSLIQPRRTGRVMDIVHPSAVVRSVPVSTPPSQLAAHRSSNVQPLSDIPITSPAGDSGSSSPQSEEPVPPKPDEFTESPPKPDYQTAERNDAPARETSSSVSENLYSAFVPDAKVEKRPLGGGPSVAFESRQPYTEPRRQDLEMAAESQLPAQPEDQLPAELHDELLVVESGTTVKTAEKSATQAIDPSLRNSTAAKAMASRYAQSDNSSEPVESDIFNTDTFHPPLAHPQKTGSGWLRVLLIILVILFGIAAAALVYLYVL